MAIAGESLKVACEAAAPDGPEALEGKEISEEYYNKARDAIVIQLAKGEFV